MTRFATVLLLSVLVACSSQTREERARERAEREIESARKAMAEAREKMSEAREKMNEARDRMSDATEEWRDQASDDARRAVDEIDVPGLVGQVLQDVGQALKNETGVTPVDFRKLRELLPDEIAGMERFDTEGESAGAFGIQVSHAKARYRSEDGRRLEVEVVDLGSLQTAAEHGVDLIRAHVDRESADGWERTMTIEGHPAHGKWHTWSGRGEAELTVLVADRFIVHLEARGDGLSEDIIDQVIDEIPIDRLTSLAD